MTDTLDRHGFDLLFDEARTHNKWRDEPVPDALLRKVYDTAKMAPTSANCQPMRVIFVRSAEGKEKLKPCLMSGNVDKTMNAPVCAIICHDMEFYEHLPTLFPHTDARSWFAGKPDAIFDTAFRNGTLGGAYLIMAARAHGLDCGPMSGFDKARVDEAFLQGTTWKSNFLCNLGYGDASALHPRSPRPAFDDFCKLA